MGVWRILPGSVYESEHADVDVYLVYKRSVFVYVRQSRPQGYFFDQL